MPDVEIEIQAEPKHHVYSLFDAAGDLLYVGVTSNLPARIDAHRRSQPWWDRVARVTADEFPDRAEADRDEMRLIRELQPPMNRTGTDRARKVATDQPATQRIIVSMPDELIEAIDAKAARLDRSRAWVIRNAVAEEIAAIRSGKTNPIHRESE